MKGDVKKMVNLIGDSLEFSIGDFIYHKVYEEGQKRGLIVDWKIEGDTKLVHYLVSFGPGIMNYLLEEEVTAEKPVEF